LKVIFPEGLWLVKADASEFELAVLSVTEVAWQPCPLVVHAQEVAAVIEKAALAK